MTSLSFLFAGAARTVLLVSADTTTKFLARRDTQTRILFGDGAAAFVLQAAPFHGSRVRSYTYGSDGAGAPLFRLETCEDGGTHAKPSCHSQFGGLRQAAVKMDGRSLFRFAVERGCSLVSRLCADAGANVGNVSKVIAHQANARIIEALQERTEIQPERWVVNIGRVGNLAGVSMPMALVDALESEELNRGDLVLMLGFGAGLSWAGMLVEW